jgi:hypothetical protein
MELVPIQILENSVHCIQIIPDWKYMNPLLENPVVDNLKMRYQKYTLFLVAQTGIQKGLTMD